jgi:hypothetical protein
MSAWVKKDGQVCAETTTAEGSEAVPTARGRGSAVKYSYRKYRRKEGGTVCPWLDKRTPRSRFQTCRHAAHLGAGDIKGETRVSGVENLGAALACYPSKSSTGWASPLPRCDVMMVEPCLEAGYLPQTRRIV